MEMNDCINSILSNTQNTVYNYFKRKLQEYETTPSQYTLLRCLWKQDGLTPSQLAQALRLDTSTVTGILGRLEKKGLIVRNYNPEDRRSVSIHLCEGGKVLWKQIDQAIDEANAKILSGIDQESYSQFLACLSVMEKNAVSE